MSDKRKQKIKKSVSIEESKLLENIVDLEDSSDSSSNQTTINRENKKLTPLRSSFLEPIQEKNNSPTSPNKKSEKYSFFQQQKEAVMKIQNEQKNN